MPFQDHRRAPAGYSIKQWADGTFHAYHGGTCLDELLTRDAALTLVWEHKWQAEKKEADEFQAFFNNYIAERRNKAQQEHPTNGQ